jgi:hypothetical protein
MNKKELIWELMELREQKLDAYPVEYMFGYKAALDEAIDLIMPFLIKIKDLSGE